MAIESKVVEADPAERPSEFPILMRSVGSDKVVVAFTGLREGIVVDPGQGSDDILHYDSNWQPCTNSTIWKRFEGQVVLSNK